MEPITYQPIGIIHSQYKKVEEIPIQPKDSQNNSDKEFNSKEFPNFIEIDDEFIAGLKDLEGFSHIYLIYHFHKVNGYKLNTAPFLSKEPKGIFAIRAPVRPNPIGLSIVRIVKIEKNIIYLDNVDVLDGTPVLDIKPYIPNLNPKENVKIGWLENKAHKMQSTVADDRFKD